MNTIFFPIRYLFLAAICTANAVDAQVTMLPQVDIRSAANSAYKVEAAAVQCSVLSPAPESGLTKRDVAFYTFDPGASSLYSITPVKDSDPLQGVSTMDLLKMVRHIQNIEPFAEPWQWMAADIDRDNLITFNDVRQLRQLLLDPWSELSDNQSWRFYDARHAFPMAFPLEEPVPESVSSTLVPSQAAFRFCAVKVGDVDGSATRTDVPLQASAAAAMLTLPDRLLAPGEAIDLALTVNDAAVLWGLQGALRLDTEAVCLEYAEPGNMLGMGPECLAFGVQRKELMFCWYDAFPQRFTEESILLTIRLTARKSVRLQEAVSLSPALLHPEAYDAQGRPQPLQISLSEVSKNTVLNVSKKSLFLNATETPQPPQTLREFSMQEEW